MSVDQSWIIGRESHVTCILGCSKRDISRFSTESYYANLIQNYISSYCNGWIRLRIGPSIATKFIKTEIENFFPSKIMIWSDGSCYQNRNIKLVNAFREVAKEYKVVIKQKYLNVGHTQMEVDSIHSTIERKLDRRREVYVPADYLQIVKSARETPSPFKTVSLSFMDFQF